HEFWQLAFDLQACKSLRNAYKYVSKEDLTPIVKNVPKNALGIVAQVGIWSSRPRPFSTMDPFVMGQWNMWRFLEAVHTEAASKNYTPKQLPAYTNPGYDGWPAAVLAWWNGWSLDGWHHKKPQLFLCGPPNTGKSTFIMKLVHGLKVFYPCSGSFAFTGLDDTYDLILIEEYKKDDFPRNVLIRLLEGLEISFNQKYLPAKKLCWRKPICLVTN
ncbi:uncharacterized protein B4U79_17114, partial [Dinothrombium tinctorium]